MAENRWVTGTQQERIALKKNPSVFQVRTLKLSKGVWRTLQLLRRFFFGEINLEKNWPPPINPGCWLVGHRHYQDDGFEPFFGESGIPKQVDRLVCDDCILTAGGSGSFPSDQQRSNFLCSNLHKHRGEFSSSFCAWQVGMSDIFCIFQTQREGEEDDLLDDSTLNQKSFSLKGLRFHHPKKVTSRIYANI